MLLNNKFKINLQTFAEPIVDPVVEPVVNPVVEPKVADKIAPITKEDVAKIVAESLKEVIPTLIPKAEKPIDDTDKGEELPQYVKVLMEEIESLKKQNTNKAQGDLSLRKNEVKKAYELDDSDLEGIDNEGALNILVKNLDKITKRAEVEFKKDLPNLLKKENKTIVDLNSINNSEKKFNKNTETKSQAFSSFLKSLI